MQKLSARPEETALPHRISDLTPKSWDGSHEKGQFRNSMAELHLWMQALSDQGERNLVRVESVDKVERSTLAVHCTEADFRTVETALYQVSDWTTTNEPLRMVQQVLGHRGFEASHLIVRRCDQRNTSERSSAYAALISSISERDRAKDVEHFGDMLRNFINETNKYERRFWNIRDEEKISAVKKVAAREFAELSIPSHHIAIRIIAPRAGEHNHAQAGSTKDPDVCVVTISAIVSENAKSYDLVLVSHLTRPHECVGRQPPFALLCATVLAAAAPRVADRNLADTSLLGAAYLTISLSLFARRVWFRQKEVR